MVKFKPWHHLEPWAHVYTCTHSYYMPSTDSRSWIRRGGTCTVAGGIHLVCILNILLVFFCSPPCSSVFLRILPYPSVFFCIPQYSSVNSILLCTSCSKLYRIPPRFCFFRGYWTAVTLWVMGWCCSCLCTVHVQIVHYRSWAHSIVVFLSNRCLWQSGSERYAHSVIPCSASINTYHLACAEGSALYHKLQFSEDNDML